jgi:hypothetical protein
MWRIMHRKKCRTKWVSNNTLLTLISYTTKQLKYAQEQCLASISLTNLIKNGILEGIHKMNGIDKWAEFSHEL